MNVRTARQFGRIDLNDGADHHDLPIGPRLGDSGQQLPVQAPIDHAGEAEARAPNAGLIYRLRGLAPGSAEMLQIDAAREKMDVVMKTALRLVEAVAAGEDDVGELEQLGFAPFRARRRGSEGRRFIHAIVDYKEWIETPGEGHCRWRVVPEDVIADLVFEEEFIEQERLFYRRRLGVIRPLTQTRRHDNHPAVAPSNVQSRNHRAEDRLFHEENAPFKGRSAHQMLRSLAHEIPSQA